MQKQRRRRLLWTAFAALALLSLLLCLRPAPEPRFQGATLEEWLGSYHGEEDAASLLAVRELAKMQGTTNVCLRYARQLVVREPPWSAKICDWLNHRLPKAWHHATARERGNHALAFFDLLGPEAAPAIPRLFELWLAPDRDVFERAAIGMALFAIGPGGEPYIPELVRELESSRGAKRRSLDLLGLTAFARRPELAVPALLRTLDDPDLVIAHGAVLALGKYGTNAVAALPRLRKLAEDPNSPAVPHMEDFRHLRDAASEAISEIEAGLPPSAAKP